MNGAGVDARAEQAKPHQQMPSAEPHHQKEIDRPAISGMVTAARSAYLVTPPDTI